MNFAELIGYIASVTVAAGMLMSSIRLLRWFNLIGAFAFTIYGILIKAWPVALVNGFITIVDIYYLGQMYFKKEYFTILPVRSDNKYLLKFIEYYAKDIEKYYPTFVYKPEENKYSFFVLRNMAVAGLFLASEYEPEVLQIILDYTTPDYRDFKVGKYVYNKEIELFKKDDYKLLIAFPAPKNEKYLQKMGFQKANYKGKLCYIKKISDIVPEIEGKIE